MSADVVHPTDPIMGQNIHYLLSRPTYIYNMRLACFTPINELCPFVFVKYLKLSLLFDNSRLENLVLEALISGSYRANRTTKPGIFSKL